MHGSPRGTFYYAKDCQHVKIEMIYVSRSGESVLNIRGWRKSFNLPQFSTYSKKEMIYVSRSGESVLNIMG
jgi:hypothetical protein